MKSRSVSEIVEERRNVCRSSAGRKDDNRKEGHSRVATASGRDRNLSQLFATLAVCFRVPLDGVERLSVRLPPSIQPIARSRDPDLFFQPQTQLS
jgi:hypothetical protein